MTVATFNEKEQRPDSEEPTGADLLLPLMTGHAAQSSGDRVAMGVVVGTLVAIKADGQVPLVLFEGQPGVVAARSVLPIASAQLGKQVVTVCECNDPAKPIILGVLNDGKRAREPEREQVEVSADGECLVVSAKRQIVLRCGKASITLTDSGKVLIQGEYVSTRATGVQRIRGGSVQIN